MVISCCFLESIMGVYSFTNEHSSLEPVSFHMPGHKGSEIYRRFGYHGFLSDFPDRDITEIPGADNLFQPESIIAETMSKYRQLYDVCASYLLINGSSGGLIASIMTCVEAGGKLIMARNCHKSVFNALRLGDITPVYAYPDIEEGHGISGAVNPDHIRELVREHPDAKAIILPSPNYYGICSDLKLISHIAHEAGMYVIVDQAHGAHLRFFENSKRNVTGMSMPPSAESSGADIVINSTHKTLCSLTQSAVLNVCTDRIDTIRLEDRLQMIESTSPSYILMESLDINADILSEHGAKLIAEWEENLQNFYREADKVSGLSVMRAETMDITKINLDMSSLGIDGATLERKLMERGIFPELTTGNILMCMTGIGNTERDYRGLLEALREISAEAQTETKQAEGLISADREKDSLHIDCDSGCGSSPWAIRRSCSDIPSEYERIELLQAAGRVCAVSLIPYPPGIPLICPGEVILKEDIDYISRLRDDGEKVIGIDQDGSIAVGTESDHKE